MEKKIAILIPCYNEALTVQDTIKEWQKAVPEATIYVYDNNSTDNTYSLAREMGIVVKKEPKQGKGNVMRSMFKDIDADCYIMVDGDNTYPADNAREMIDEVLNNGTDLVIGDRLGSSYFTENKRPFHGIGNIVVKNSINLLFGAKISDAMSGLRALSPAFAKDFPCVSSGFEIETEMDIYAAKKGYKIKSIVTPYQDRPEGSSSKLNTFRDGMKVIKYILKMFFCWRKYEEQAAELR